MLLRRPRLQLLPSSPAAMQVASLLSQLGLGPRLRPLPAAASAASAHRGGGGAAASPSPSPSSSSSAAASAVLSTTSVYRVRCPPPQCTAGFVGPLLPPVAEWPPASAAYRGVRPTVGREGPRRVRAAAAAAGAAASAPDVGAAAAASTSAASSATASTATSAAAAGDFVSVALYCLADVEDPHRLVQRHREFVLVRLSAVSPASL